MNNVNKTLYIPLYGKAYVSKKNIILQDKKAEELWEQADIRLRGKSKSKWLAYYMGVRSAVFDEWVREQTEKLQGASVIHIGCGMDSRVIRVGAKNCKWYDVDFEQVIEERKRYYVESDNYKMIAGDVRERKWLESVQENERAIVIMEGVSMYLTMEEMQALRDNLCAHFKQLSLLVDCYSSFAAKMSKRRNPVKDVGVTKVYGIDDPKALQNDEFSYVQERTMIPKKYVRQLKGLEKIIFGKLYAGGFSKKLYRLFEYQK